MSDNIEMLFFGIVIGIMIGGLLTALNIGYQMKDKAIKTETENSVIYTYTESWEIFKNVK